jgi:gliding motility-associated protein GldM
MAIPKEPRQQMINLMYLVLTALLALNVSSEILNAFNVIDKSLQNSGRIVDLKNGALFKGFAAQKLKEPGNAAIPVYEKHAQDIMQWSKELQTEVDDLQKELIKEAGGIVAEDGLMAKKDDVEIPTRLLVEGAMGKGDGKGYALKKKLDDLRNKMLGIVKQDDKEREAKNLTINTTPVTKQKDWVRENFAQMPAIAAQTMLTKVKQDIKNAEGQMIEYCYKQIGSTEALKEEDIVFNVFSAKITAPSTYLMEGEAFEADVFLAASSSESKGKVSINVNGSNIAVNNEGVAKYRTVAGLGEHPVSASITVTNDRTKKQSTYKTEPLKFTVAAPSAAISLDKMNVFYIGVDNPVSVNAAGVRTADLNVSMSNGSISGSNGAYTVRVSAPAGRTTVSVKSNKGKVLAAKEYRVKFIPDPEPRVGNKKAGAMPAGEMKAQMGVAAILENFDFDAKFEVLSFNIGIAAKREDFVLLPNSGAIFSSAVKAALGKVKPGDIVYVEEIKVRGPDGTTRKLSSIAYKLM